MVLLATLVALCTSGEVHYCLCELPLGHSCEHVCPARSTVIPFDSEVLDSPDSFVPDDSSISFSIVGTERKAHSQPSFVLGAFAKFNVSFHGIGGSHPEFISLVPGDLDTGTNWTFDNLNLLFTDGRFGFDRLEFKSTSLFLRYKRVRSEISIRHLVTDFQTFSDLPDHLDIFGPTESIYVHLNESLTNLLFRPDHTVLAEYGRASAFFDLLQIPSRGGSIIFEIFSRTFRISFVPQPQTLDDFASVSFWLRRSSQIFIDFQQLDDDVMDLTDFWTFNFTRHSIFLSSPPGVTLPTFTLIGHGPLWLNNEPANFTTAYCLCRKKCKKCPGDHARLHFADIDKSIVGNPNHNLSYVVIGSNATLFPLFDLEHFGDKFLNVTGLTDHEHIGVFDVKEDHDRGHHDVSSVNLHLLDSHVQFPGLCLRDVGFECETPPCVVNSTRLEIDYPSIMNATASRVDFGSPPNGIEVDTAGFVSAVDLVMHTPLKIGINNVNVTTHSFNSPEFVIDVVDTVNVYVGTLLRSFPDSSLVPPIRIRAKGDVSLTFQGPKWPPEYDDLTAKIVVEHGTHPLFLNGKVLRKGVRQPSIVSHEGTGHVYVNDQPITFQSEYCVCIEEACATPYQHLGPVIAPDVDSISATVKKNPSRVIQYHIRQTSKTTRAVFNLSDFRRHSIEVIGEPPAFVRLVADEHSDGFLTTTAVTHTFRDVSLRFGGEGVYTFNDVVLQKVAISRAAAIDDGLIKVKWHGLTVDMDTLRELNRVGLLVVPSRHLVVLGGEQLTEFHLTRASILEIQDAEAGPIAIDLSSLHATTVLKCRQKVTIAWEVMSGGLLGRVPRVLVDLTDTDENDVYVTFTGKNWITHTDLRGILTISHGQANVHLNTDVDEHGQFAGMPPMVTLDGSGDLYANDRKQVSILALQPSVDSVAEGDDTGIWLKVLILGSICGAIAAFWYCRPGTAKVPRRKGDQQPLEPKADAFQITEEEDLPGEAA
jgi:hypothetical protein